MFRLFKFNINLSFADEKGWKTKDKLFFDIYYIFK